MRINKLWDTIVSGWKRYVLSNGMMSFAFDCKPFGTFLTVRLKKKKKIVFLKSETKCFAPVRYDEPLRWKRRGVLRKRRWAKNDTPYARPCPFGEGFFSNRPLLRRIRVPRRITRSRTTLSGRLSRGVLINGT